MPTASGWDTEWSPVRTRQGPSKYRTILACSPTETVGSHLKLRYESPDTDELRIVTARIKSADDIPTETLQSIAQQCGATDFYAWCRWVNQTL